MKLRWTTYFWTSAVAFNVRTGPGEVTILSRALTVNALSPPLRTKVASRIVTWSWTLDTEVEVGVGLPEGTVVVVATAQTTGVGGVTPGWGQVRD